MYQCRLAKIFSHIETFSRNIHEKLKIRVFPGIQFCVKWNYSGVGLFLCACSLVKSMTFVSILSNKKHKYTHTHIICFSFLNQVYKYVSPSHHSFTYITLRRLTRIMYLRTEILLNLLELYNFIVQLSNRIYHHWLLLAGVRLKHTIFSWAAQLMSLW